MLTITGERPKRGPFTQNVMERMVNLLSAQRIHQSGDLETGRIRDSLRYVPPDVMDTWRKMGWTDDEILEGLEDAADFLNSRFCDETRGYMSLRDFFEQGPE